MRRESKRETKRLSDESAAEYYEMGERFAQRVKLDSAVKRVNDFGQKCPIQLFFMIVFTLVCAILINLYLYYDLSRDMPLGDIPEWNFDSSIQAEEQEAKAKITEELQSLYAETEHLVDTLIVVMAKETLTKEDSLFVMKKMARLEALDRVLNEEYVKDGDNRED